MARRRNNGEGSFYEAHDSEGNSKGWVAYVWVTRPDGSSGRKYIYGQDPEALNARWVRLKSQALDGPMETSEESLEAYGRYWLEEVVKPNLTLGTYTVYKGWFDRQIAPGMGSKRLSRLLVKDAQKWFNTVATACQCCHQGKDVKRVAESRRCCAVGKCCNQRYSKESLNGLRRTLRALYSSAIVDELAAKNVGALVKLPKVRKASRAKQKAKRRWSTEEAHRFLKSARDDEDPNYAAYAYVVVLGFRKGEALGVDESEVDLDAAELDLGFQLQRLGTQLVRSETKTDESEDTVPLPDICIAATQQRLTQKARQAAATEAWQGSTLITTTRFGTAKEPRTFNREWDRRCELAGVPRITPREARVTCGSILADLDVHPRVAMKVLRHAKFDITMEVYSRPSSEVTRAALQRLGQALE